MTEEQELFEKIRHALGTTFENATDWESTRATDERVVWWARAIDQDHDGAVAFFEEDGALICSTIRGGRAVFMRMLGPHHDGTPRVRVLGEKPLGAPDMN